MKYTLSIEAASFDELQALISAMNTPKENKVVTPEEPKKAKPKKTAVVDVQVEPEAAEVEPPYLKEVKKPEKEEMSYATVSELTLELMSKTSMAKIKEILGQFGAKKATELKPEQWSDYVGLVRLHLKEVV